jgi:hypothetical protein
VEKKTFNGFLTKPEIVAAAKGRHIRLMFQDEARFGRICDPRACWGPDGQRPVVPSGIVREYIYAYAAVSPEDGGLVTLVLPHANTWGMNLFLAEIAKRYPDDFIVLILDGASWHRSKSLQIPENMHLERLPPYSPKLNPVEHFWQELREKDFHNRVFKTLDDLQAYLADCLARLESQPTRIKKMTCWTWINEAITLQAA